MLYTPTTRPISKEGDSHPKQVLVLLEAEEGQLAWNGWVPNFAGATYLNDHTVQGNGDLMGDVFWTRSNTDSQGKQEEYVRVSQPAYEYYLALILAIAWQTDQIRGYGEIIEDSLSMRRLLLIWNDLDDEEVEGIVTGLLKMDDLLWGARDKIKRRAALKIRSAQDIRDIILRLNPRATYAKLRKAEPDIQNSKEHAQQSLINLTERLPQAERLVAYLEWKTAELDRFLDGRETLMTADVATFYDIGRDSLKPLNQLVNWLCLMIQQGNGRITDPEILAIARRGLGFGRLYGRIVRILRLITSFSVVEAETNSERYRSAWLPEVIRLRLLLDRLRGQIGGPFDDLLERLYALACTLEVAVIDVKWEVAIAVAKQLRHLLVYRSTNDNPAPEAWYGVTPPGSNPIELTVAYNQAIASIDTSHLPTNDVDWLPRGPR